MRITIVALLAGLWGYPLWAGQCGLEFCWGAVGISEDDAVGWSRGFETAESAIAAVQEGCDEKCTTVKSFYDTCGALAVAANGSWGWGWDDSLAKAKSIAISFCSDGGGQCRAKVWACSY